MKDAHDSLSKTLAEWRVNPTPDPAFRSAVWQRIGQRSRETWAGYVRAHRLGLAMMMLLTVGLAGWTGRVAARAKLEAQREAMADSYLVGLDPRVQAKLRH